MLTGHVFIATSLDGFIARRDGDIDWLLKQATEGEDYGYDAFIADVDGLIMGSASFHKVLGFETWPYPKPVVVMSSRLSESDIPAELRGRVSISALPPRALVERLSADGWRRAYVDGGRVIQSFLREGLVSDMVVTLIPILLGEGIPLFGPLARDVDLELVAAAPYASGLLRTHYRVRDTR